MEACFPSRRPEALVRVVLGVTILIRVFIRYDLPSRSSFRLTLPNLLHYNLLLLKLHSLLPIPLDFAGLSQEEGGLTATFGTTANAFLISPERVVLDNCFLRAAFAGMAFGVLFLTGGLIKAQVSLVGYSDHPRGHAPSSILPIGICHIASNHSSGPPRYHSPSSRIPHEPC